MKNEFDRRQFLTRTGAAAVLLVPSARIAFGYRANERFNLGVVGMKGYGAYHGFGLGLHQYENVGYTHSCDVDLRKVKILYDDWDKRAAEWAQSEKAEQRDAAKQIYRPLTLNRPPLHADFRRMLDRAGDEIDAVVVATPDHTHASISALALRAGKPVFAEKPLTVSPHEARALTQLATASGLATQMNNHGGSRPAFRRAMEIIREGLLGDVTEVHTFFSRGGRDFRETPHGRQAVPEELDWNLWLAQCPWRDYHPDWINRIGWRGTSIGELGNFGPHSTNLAFLSLNLVDLWNGSTGAPISITAECSGANQISYPKWERITWQVPARKNLAPVTFTWHHGPKSAGDYAPGTRSMLAGILRDHGATEADTGEMLGDAGCLILGNKGVLVTNSHNTRFKLLPKNRFEPIEQARPLQPQKSTGNHYRDWVDAARGGESEPISQFQNMAPFAEFLTVGSITTRFPGDTIEFDPATGTIGNHSRAAEFLAYPYREGWQL